MADPVVLGLDLSIAATGWSLGGVTGTWLLPAATGDRRLVTLRTRVDELLQQGRVDLAVIEGFVVHSNAAATIGMVHGAIRSLLIARRVPYALVAPATLKKYATGRGGAAKPDMRMELYKRAGIDLPDDNQVDAWWLHAAGLDHLGHPPLALPENHRQALTKIIWPRIEVPVP